MAVSSVSGCAVADIPAATTETVLAATNKNRQFFTICNVSTATLYLKFGIGCTPQSYSVAIPPGWYYESPLPIYQGVISGIWSAVNGSAKVSQFS